jgi:hypothetical protein
MSEKPARRNPKRRRWIALASVAFLVTAGAVLWHAAPGLFEEEYASFAQSEGDYRVVVVKYRVWRAVMPGQGGDAPGAVRLYDRHGNLLHEISVPMVNLVDQVSWEADTVRIKSVATWELPH